MPSPVERINKPIFVVGSPRSGTSILSWCLGQHPNILVQEESDWLGRFAIDVAMAYKRGTLRGERAQLSTLDVQREEFFAIFGSSINKLILDHRRNLELKRLRDHHASRTATGPMGRCWRPASSSDPKSRWVDGTPEYSLYICALRKLFPRAVFVHITRDVTDVVRSLLNFRPNGGNRLVNGEQEAYEYWLRRASACAEAERAYGTQVVYRIRYSDLIVQPEAAMRSLLHFVGEPFAQGCLDPLTERINSSNVPADYDETDCNTDRDLVACARRLSDQFQTSPQRHDVSPEAAINLEAEFDRQVEYFATLEAQLHDAKSLFHQLQNEQNLHRAGADRNF